ncbi:MAG: NYN domain-containing protein, partial [Acidihalobacter sp.]
AKLVERLKSFMARKRKTCTVIFDGGLPGGPSRDLSTYSVRVVFAHNGTNADRIIMERIRSTRDSGSLVIVSADHEIVDAAHRKKMQIIAPAAFAAEMDAPTAPPLRAADRPTRSLTRRRRTLDPQRCVAGSCGCLLPAVQDVEQCYGSRIGDAA